MAQTHPDAAKGVSDLPRGGGIERGPPTRLLMFSSVSTLRVYWMPAFAGMTLDRRTSRRNRAEGCGSRGAPEGRVDCRFRAAFRRPARGVC